MRAPGHRWRNIAGTSAAIEALEGKKSVDYAPTLAALTQQLERLSAATANLAKAPALKLTPDGYAAQLRRATDDASRPAAAELQRVQMLTATLERALGGVRTREEQLRWIVWAATGGVAAGAMLTLFAVRMLGS